MKNLGLFTLIAGLLGAMGLLYFSLPAGLGMVLPFLVVILAIISFFSPKVNKSGKIMALIGLILVALLPVLVPFLTPMPW
ncbi:MAG TPA: hypothetical protein VJH06_04215 [Candidatus Paceibacterota bacterium]